MNVFLRAPHFGSLDSFFADADAPAVYRWQLGIAAVALDAVVTMLKQRMGTRV